MFCLFHAFNPFWEKFYQTPVQFFSVIPVAYPFRIATQLQYYVKREKCKVNDVIFPFGCEARAINLGNKNMKIGIFTGGTSVRSKNIFTDISRYPAGNREIKQTFQRMVGEYGPRWKRLLWNWKNTVDLLLKVVWKSDQKQLDVPWSRYKCPAYNFDLYTTISISSCFFFFFLEVGGEVMSWQMQTIHRNR